MIEKSIYNYLKTEQDIGVYLERPKDPPERYYLIEKTSGGMTNHIMNSTIIVQSYARSLYEAADMNESIIHLYLELHLNLSLVKSYLPEILFDIFLSELLILISSPI